MKLFLACVLVTNNPKAGGWAPLIPSGKELKVDLAFDVSVLGACMGGSEPVLKYKVKRPRAVLQRS